MPAVAQGIKKITVYKKQSGLGVPAAGGGGQIVRRKTSVFQAPRDTFESDEIVSHHQSTGVAYGLKKAAGKIDGLLSAGTYKDFFAALLEAAYVAGVTAAGASITIAGAGPTYTVTRAAGSYLTDGFKIGDVVRLSVGAFNAANLAKNLYVVGITATVLTVQVLNGSTLTAEGPVAGSTVSVAGKKVKVPLTGHTKDYFTVEEFYSDLTKSELFTDMRVGKIALGLPASGNSTIGIDFVGTGRTLGGAQVLTTPTAETQTLVMSSINGAVYANGVLQTACTGVTLEISNGAADVGGVIGSDSTPDVASGRIKVSGSFTAMFTDTVIQALFDGETATSLIGALTADQTAAADFLTFSLSKIKLTGDAPDDGEKGILRTYPFTAEINPLGGAALANDNTIISVQDSAA